MKGKTVRFLLIILAAIGAAYFGSDEIRAPQQPAEQTTADRSIATRDDTDLIAAAFRDGRSSVQVRGSGIVDRMLADDNNGSRHQRFVLALRSGQTVLVAHNIDLAPRVANLREGDRVTFFGEYEWNERGGVIHWTHADPAGHHIGGWLEHDGRRYE